MRTISAKKIDSALEKAKGIGVVYEPVVIDDLALVLRNLRPDEYAQINDETKEKEGIDQLYSYQKSHLCRSIVEINGVDLRDVDLIEVEEVVKDPKTQEAVIDPETNTPKVKKFKIECHAYVRKYILDGWTKEPLQVAWRKFGDVLKLSEDKSTKGVQFVMPEGTPEERLREYVGNLLEIIDEVPRALVDSILEEAGLMRLSTAEEIKKVMERTDQLAREQEEKEEREAAAAQAKEQGHTPPPQDTRTPQVVAPAPVPPQDPRVRQPTAQEVQERMARRTPMNTENVAVPHPGGVQPTIATQPTQHPPLPQQPPQAPPQPPQASGHDSLRAAGRAQRIAQLEEGQLDFDTPTPPGDPNLPVRHISPGSAQGPALPNAPHLQPAPPEVATLTKGHEKVDMKAFGKIVDQAPKSGFNPRFRPPSR